MPDSPKGDAAPANRAAKLCQLADDLYDLQSRLVQSAMVIFPALFADDSPEGAKPLKRHIQFVADSLPRLVEIKERLADPDISHVVAGIVTVHGVVNHIHRQGNAAWC